MKIDLRKLKTDLSGDISQNKVFIIGTYAALGLVGLVMTILNIVTNKGWLTVATGAFALLCGISVALTLISKHCAKVGKFLFAVGVLLMFTFFLVTGEPEGFSAIWICMLPSLGMFFFDRLRGSVLCAVMFGLLAFLLWTPLGNAQLMFDYSDTFKMRFPVLFLAFHLLAFLLETLRVHAYEEMRRMQAYYRDLSVRDQLTGVFNRQGMYSALESDPVYAGATRLGVAMFDIDFFKMVNDTYGHGMGDTVLKEFASIIKENLHAVVCRWGGEEFVAVFADGQVTLHDIKQVKSLVARHEFEHEGRRFGVTMSIGFCESDRLDVSRIDRLIDSADGALYEAKRSGRNRIVVVQDVPPETDSANDAFSMIPNRENGG